MSKERFSKGYATKRRMFLLGCLFFGIASLSGYFLFWLNPDFASKPIFQVSLLVAGLLSLIFFRRAKVF